MRCTASVRRVSVAGSLGPGKVRLAELVAALSLGVDLGFGQPMEHVLRQCLIALRLGERVGLDEGERLVVYYTALLVNVGCHSDAHEQAKWFGDDIALKSGKYDHEQRSLRGAAGQVAPDWIGQPAVAPIPGRPRVRSVRPPRPRWDDRSSLRSGPDPGRAARVAERRARSRRRGLRAMGRQGLAGPAQGYGGPGRVAPRAIGRVRRGGSSDRRGRRRGRAWPPACRYPVRPRAARHCFVRACRRDPGRARRRRDLGGGDRGRACAWREAVAEPSSTPRCSRSPTSSISSRPTCSATPAPFPVWSPAPGRSSGSPATRLGTLRRAGLVHGLGRLGVSNAIWDKRGPLGAGEWERVRMQPYLTERMLHQSPSLAPLGAIAVQHRERLDGSGYPRGLSGGAISAPARVLGAADAYQSMREPRPHRGGAHVRGRGGGAAGRGQGRPARRGCSRGRAGRRRTPCRPAT